MKTTITIRQHGDVVYFLDSKGFQKGTVKTTHVISEKHNPLEIIYRVVCKDDNGVYMGDAKKPTELFDSMKQMIDYFQALV